jgi:hypothetical protein
MPEHSREDDIGSIWRNQPEEPLSIDVERFVRRRTRALHSITRNEILMSMAAALLFVAVVAWRLASDAGPLPEIGMAATILWVLISLYRFRARIGRAGAPDAAAMAATGREYYRRELERRRDHLKNEWLRHGPLALACLTLGGVLAGRAFWGAARLWSALPLVVLLAAWIAISIRRRRREADELQSEIDQLP